MNATAPEPNDFQRLGDQYLMSVLESAASSPLPSAVLQQREGLNRLMSLMDTAVIGSREHSAISATIETCTAIQLEAQAKAAILKAQVKEQSQTIDLLQKQVELLDLQQQLASMRIQELDRHRTPMGEPSQVVILKAQVEEQRAVIAELALEVQILNARLNVSDAIHEQAKLSPLVVRVAPESTQK